MQGRLADSAGVAVDGAHLIHFKLYGDSAGTSVVWEDDLTVDVDQGAFSVYLGAQKELDLKVFADLPEVWLGVAVDTDPQMDLVPIAHVPKAAWADQAGHAEMLGGYEAEDFLLEGWTPAWADVAFKPAWAEDGYTGGTGVDVTGATISLDAAELAGLVALTCYESPAELTAALDGIYAPAFTIGEGIVLGDDGTLSLDADVVDAQVAALFGDAETVAAVAEFAATNDLSAINGLTADAEVLGTVADWAEATDLDALSDLAAASGTLGVLSDWADQTDLDALAALAENEPTLAALVADQLVLDALADDQTALTALAVHQVALAALAADQAALTALAADQLALTGLAGDASALGALADVEAALSALAAREAALVALASDPTLADGDQDTTYTNGTGLTLTGTTFAVSQSYVDGRATTVAYDTVGELTTALAGQYRAAGYVPAWAEITSKPAGFADGVDDNTTYTNGTGLTLTGTTFAVSESAIDTMVANNGYAADADLVSLEDRLDDIEGALPASPNLLLDTRAFSAIPAGPTVLNAATTYGPWSFFAYDGPGTTLTVEDPPADLIALVSGSNWWPQPYKVLRVKVTNGATPSRILQMLQPSEKPNGVTTSAWVKVLSGGAYLGQESSWDLHTNATWTKVSTYDVPLLSLGGAYGFAGRENTASEFLIALPKAESSPVATPWIEAPYSARFADSLNATPSMSTTTSTFTTMTNSTKSVTVPTAATLLVNWSFSAFAGAGGGGWVVRPVVGGVAGAETVCYSNEGSSHKNCSGTSLISAAQGTQNLSLQVRVYIGDLYMNGDDHLQWTAVQVN